MIALENICGDAGAIEPGDLAIKEQPRRAVLPVTIVNVTGNNDEIDGIVDRLLNQAGKGLTGGIGKARGNVSILDRKPLEWATKMKVSCMYKSK